MAQKAIKVLAARNAVVLRNTHLIALIVHGLYIFLRVLLRRNSFTRQSTLLFTFLAGPSILIELWLEKVGRPKYGSNGSVQRAGEDLDAKGLTEYLWDVLYWTWGCVVATTLFGDRLWWFWAAIPIYSVWLAWSTYSGMKGGLGGMMGRSDTNSNDQIAGESKRQKKMEKRGGQKVVYR